MKLKMHENSLFAILLRSQWWVSALVAIALTGGLRLVIPDIYAFFAGLPFAVIAVVVAWKQLRAPSEGKIGETIEVLRAMSWDEFASALEASFRRDGYTVNRISGHADLELVRGSRTTLVACKRWKAMRTGTDPLRDLAAMRKTRDAYDCLYVATGEITAQARTFARDHNMQILEGAELAKKIGLRKKPAA
jgi:restriction system protein